MSIIVENVRSAFNVGSILRTADALRVRQVYLVGYSAPGDHPRVHRAALGAQDSVPWTRCRTFDEAADLARRDGCTLVALEITDDPTPVSGFDLDDFPVALVVGNEVDGVSDAALARCDRAVELPQFGMKHSLNVAVACGVAGYDLLRRYLALAGGSDP